MAIKRIIGKINEKYKSCLRCGQHIEKTLEDDEVYTCERCGQRHFIDVYEKNIAITVAERPEVRHRKIGARMEQQHKAREALIARVERRRAEDAEWIETCREWLDELAALPEKELKREFSYMGEDTLRRVKKYLDMKK